MKYLIFILFFSIYGCATQDDRPVPADGEALLKEFEVTKEDQEQFSFKEIAPSPAPAPELRSKSIKPSTFEVEKRTTSAKQAVKKQSVYPDGYPESYKVLYPEARKTWDMFKPLIRVGESINFEITYLGIKAGNIKFMVLENGQRGDDLIHHFKATLSSADYYKYIYKLDDYVESFILADSFLPLKYTLIQRESGQSVDELQLFNHAQFQTKQWFKKIKDGKTKKDDKIAFIPRLFLDPLSLLAFFRGLPLKKGDVYSVPVIVRSKVLKVTATVLDYEMIEVLDKERDAVKMSVYVEPIEEGKKPTTMNLWYNRASSRELLKFNAELKFGSVEGEWVQ